MAPNQIHAVGLVSTGSPWRLRSQRGLAGSWLSFLGESMGQGSEVKHPWWLLADGTVWQGGHGCPESGSIARLLQVLIQC